MLTEEEYVYSPVLREYIEILSVEDEHGAHVARDQFGMFHVDSKYNPLYVQRFDKVGCFNSTATTVAELNGEQFHINFQGEALYSKRFWFAEPFEFGVAIVIQDGKYFLINMDAERVSIDFEKIDKFNSIGIAVAQYDGKQFHIDTNGNPIYDFRFDKVDRFNESGTAVATLNGKQFHINFFGKAIYQERFDKARPFVNGFAVVDVNGERFHIDFSGKAIYSKKFDYVSDFNPSNSKFPFFNAYAKKNEECFFINPQGEEFDIC